MKRKLKVTELAFLTEVTKDWTFFTWCQFFYYKWVLDKKVGEQ